MSIFDHYSWHSFHITSILPTFLACSTFFNTNHIFTIRFSSGIRRGNSKIWNFFFEPIHLWICLNASDHCPVGRSIPDLNPTFEPRTRIFIRNCLVSCRVHCVVNAYYFACSNCSKSLQIIILPPPYWTEWFSSKAVLDIPPIVPLEISSLVLSDHKTFHRNICSLLICIGIVELSRFLLFHKQWVVLGILRWRLASLRFSRTDSDIGRGELWRSKDYGHN